MIFNKEAAVIAHLVTTCAPGSVILGTLDAIDLTDDTASPVAGQVSLVQIQSAGNVRGCAAGVLLQFVFSVYCDILRASAEQKTAAETLFETAAKALVTFEHSSQQHLQITDGQSTGFDGRVIRMSIGFSIPTYLI